MVSRLTIIRDIDVLLAAGLIQKTGHGRSVKYQDSTDTPLLKFYDPATYFSVEPDNRLSKKSFNGSILDHATPLFSTTELSHLSQMTSRYQDNISRITPDIFISLNIL